MGAIEIGMPFDFDSSAPDPEEYEYSATEERMFNVASWTNGVFPQVRIVQNNILEPDAYVGQSLYVQPGTGLSVVVMPGMAIVEGTKYLLTQAKTITVEQHNQARTIDIVVELDLVNQKVMARAQLRPDGQTLGESLQRESGIYQLCIATVSIPANAAAITLAGTADQRLNTNLANDGKPICGLVSSSMQADTRMIHEQFAAQLGQNRAEFDAWFAGVQDTLDGDTAGHLLNLINTHTADADIHVTPQQKAITLTHSLDGTVHTLSGLPDAPGLYTAQFKATADFTEGDTFADGYTAKPTGEDTALPDKAFVAGDLVSIVVDTEGKRLGFKLGGGANKWNIFTGTVPPDKPDGLFVQTATPPAQVEFTQFANSAGSWLKELSPMPTTRGYLASASVGTVVYAIGGYTATNTYSKTCEAYDTVSNLWSTKADMPTGRQSLASASVGTVVYAIGGYSVYAGSSTFYNKCEAYDTASNLWSTKANMPTTRGYLASASVGTVVYAIGGTNSAAANLTASQVYNKCEAYDTASNLWSTKANMPTTRGSLASASVGTVVYAIGGFGASSTYYNQCEAYDTVSNLWSTKANMSMRIERRASASVGIVVYAIGGDTATDNYLNRCEAYDTVSNLWSTKANMPTPRHSLGAASVGAVVYAIGGYGNDNGDIGYHKMCEAYLINGDPYPANTLVVEHGYSPNLARLAKDKQVDLTLPIKHTYLHDGTKLNPVTSKTNLDGQGWQDVL